jgi:iron complex transport system substrate-binding protein
MVRLAGRRTLACDSTTDVVSAARRVMNACVLPVLLLAGASFAASPPRVVSMNPCVDAVLVRVAEARQIAGISHYSQDPAATSMALDVARQFHATSGTAEEVVALAPDHVFAGPHVSPSTVLALERMHIKLIKLPVAESVEESYRQIRVIAAVVGQPERGEMLIAEIKGAVKRAQPPDAEAITAVVWQGGGLVPGAGTLADELLRLTGFRNFSAAYGLQKWDVLPLEHLLARPPAVLLSIGTGEAGRDRLLGHPAVRTLAERVALRAFPFRLLQCAGPTISEAVTYLADIRQGLPRQ